MTKQAPEIIAWAFSTDVGDVKDGRYQRYTNPSVYTFGNDYYAVHKAKPKHDVGSGWVLHADQWACEGTGRKLWVSRARRRENE